MSMTMADTLPLPPRSVLEMLLAYSAARVPSRTSEGPSAQANRERDLELVRAVLDDEPGAQRTLLKLILPHLRAVANAILTNPADVDDAVQVAVLQIFDDLDSFRGDARLVRWARRVAARACLRMKAKNQRWLRNVAAAKSTSASPAGPEYDLPRDVAEHLARLPEVQREAVVLRHVLGHSVSEIASLTNSPLDTVKSRLLYGRRALRKMLHQEAAERGVDR